MTTQRNFMCGILILAIGVLKENIVFVRSVCLQDALTFYNSKKDACSFRKDDFNRIFLTPELGGQCNDSKQCKEVDQYSVCSRDNICKCNKGYTEISDYRLKEEKSDNSALVFGVGIAGFVLGVAVCGLFYIIMIRYRNRSQASRSDKRREDCTEKGSVLVSQTSTPHPNYNKTLGDNFEGNDVYNHLHEAPNEVSVQPDYDHVPPQVEENGDYSHMTTRNAHSSDIAGEYGKIS
ncbi:uncharacterized protein [Magallana gigas]|uniref:uncharacterized protein isoform X4 n=1 Tax=Magallana gigas TaxID=29159 RepID=UPI0033420FAA